MQLIELRSEEHRLQRQVDVIKKALFEIGCEELPSGCDLPSLDLNDIDITVSKLYFQINYSYLFLYFNTIAYAMYYLLRLMVL